MSSGLLKRSLSGLLLGLAPALALAGSLTDLLTETVRDPRVIERSGVQRQSLQAESVGRAGGTGVRPRGCEMSGKNDSVVLEMHQRLRRGTVYSPLWLSRQ